MDADLVECPLEHRPAAILARAGAQQAVHLPGVRRDHHGVVPGRVVLRSDRRIAAVDLDRSPAGRAAWHEPRCRQRSPSSTAHPRPCASPPPVAPWQRRAIQLTCAPAGPIYPLPGMLVSGIACATIHEWAVPGPPGSRIATTKQESESTLIALAHLGSRGRPEQLYLQCCFPAAALCRRPQSSCCGADRLQPEASGQACCPWPAVAGDYGGSWTSLAIGDSRASLASVVSSCVPSLLQSSM